jgi:hypothetical protein
MHHLGGSDTAEWILPNPDWSNCPLGIRVANMDSFQAILPYVPYVPFEDIEVINVVGRGRNGGCFKVKWNSTEYAMKQFDIGRDGDEYFCKEIKAYVILKKAWGELVPQPIFVSESYSGGILFLGLQLGREPTQLDDFDAKSKIILKRLESEYGIQHNDVDGRNMIIISDEFGIEKMVAIDFEDWDYA